MRKRSLLLVLALLIGLALFAAPPATASPQAAPQAVLASQTAPQAATQAGAVCADCHTDMVNAFRNTPHAASAKGCEGCHGDSKAHVAAGGGKGTMRNFTALSPADASAVCTTCHNKGEQKYWAGSTHDTRSVSCLSCHNPHPKGAVVKALLIAPEFELCTKCHLQKKAALMRSGHMPMREGKIQCSSCHNPHGTPYPRQLRQSSINQNCYSCHAEKRGPFLWEHAPVRENCMNCHDPHGTVNSNLLKVKQPMLCIQCHNGFAGGGMGNAHAARDRYGFGQSCLNCHPMIHGSMHPAGNHFKR